MTSLFVVLTPSRDLLPGAVISVALIFLAATGAGIYGWSLAAASALTACAVLLARRAGTPQAGMPPPAWQRFNWVYLAILCFLVLMLIPLPLRMTALTGAHRYTQNSVATTRLRQAAAIDAIDLPALFFSITRNRAGTLRVLAICIGAFSCASLSRRMSITGRRFLLRTLIVGGALVAWAGILSLWVFPQGDTLWWRLPIPHTLPGPAACFVNRNHFGGFAAMLCPAAIIAAADDIRKRRWSLVVLMLLCGVILGAAAPLSESRGGVVALAGALLLSLIFFFASGHHRAGLWLTLPLAVVILAVSAAALPRVGDSMRTVLNPTQTASLQSRMQVWRETLTIWRRYPILGSGPNSFHAIYPMHRQSSASGHRTHAENLYVETLADSGTMGAAIAIWAFAASVVGMRRARRARDSDPSLTFAAAAALTVVAIHALVDFAPYVPLYSLTFGALIGLALPPPSPDRFAAPPLLAAILALLLCTQAEAMQKRDSNHYIYKSDIDSQARSLIWTPTSQQAWLQAGRRLAKSKDKSVKRMGERFFSQSMAYDPMNYRHWLRLGKLRLKLKDYDGAREAYGKAKSLRSWIRIPPIPENPS